ncbi:MAG TPA: hypothetical protein VNV88_08210 [Candidatus Solibacter sp.]|nr:hypothetical protein [Candidatus Solibacter sp.]
MKPSWLSKVLAFMSLALLALAIGCGVGAQPPTAIADNETSQHLPFSGNQALVVPKGTLIYVRLEQTISSHTAQPGESFPAVLDEPLMVDGRTVAPRGAKVNGRVIAAHESGRLHNAGYLRLTLSSLMLNGKEVPIQTSSIFVKGGSYKNRNLAYIGGGAGGGALLGALVGGGKGALIGSAIGAAGGTTAAYATGKKEVGFSAERRIGFRLAEPLSIS